MQAAHAGAIDAPPGDHAGVGPGRCLLRLETISDGHSITPARLLPLMRNVLLSRITIYSETARKTAITRRSGRTLEQTCSRYKHILHFLWYGRNVGSAVIASFRLAFGSGIRTLCFNQNVHLRRGECFINVHTAFVRNDFAYSKTSKPRTILSLARELSANCRLPY